MPHGERYSIWVARGVPRGEGYSLWVVHSVPYREGYSLWVVYGDPLSMFHIECYSVYTQCLPG